MRRTPWRPDHRGLPDRYQTRNCKLVTIPDQGDSVGPLCLLLSLSWCRLGVWGLQSELVKACGCKKPTRLWTTRTKTTTRKSRRCHASKGLYFTPEHMETHEHYPSRAVINPTLVHLYRTSQEVSARSLPLLQGLQRRIPRGISRMSAWWKGCLLERFPLFASLRRRTWRTMDPRCGG